MDQAGERYLVLASKQVWEDQVKGLGNQTKAGKNVSGFEDSKQNNAKETGVHMAGGRL